MSIDEVEDMLYKETKRKEERRRKKNRQKDSGPGNEYRAPKRVASDGSSKASRLGAIMSDSLLRRRSRGARAARPDESIGDMPSEAVVVATSPSENQETASFASSSNRLSLRRHSRTIARSADEIEMSRMRAGDSTRDEDESSTSDSVAATIAIPAWIRNIPLMPSIYTSSALAIQALRREHRAAARAEVSQSRATSLGGSGAGWGLGNYGLREREEAERRIRDFQEERRRRMLLSHESSMPGETDGEDEGGWHDEEGVTNEIAASSLSAGGSGSHKVGPSPTLPPTVPPTAHTRPRLKRRGRGSDGSLPHPLPPSDSLFWRWGPLRRWRLQDRTTY